MVIYPKNLEHLLKQIKGGYIRGAMFYGSEKGLIDHCISQIEKVLDLHQHKITYEEIKDKSLNEILNSIGLFSIKEIIVISNVPSSYSKQVSEVLAKPCNNFPIFIADSADSLKQLFQKDDNLACVPCYTESTNDLKVVITKYLGNKTIDHKSLEYLVYNLSSDRSFLYSELDKLLIYCHDSNQITWDDVNEVIVPLYNPAIDRLILSFVRHDARVYFDTLANLMSNNVSEMLIIRSVVKYYLNLYTVKQHMRRGVDIDAALKLLKPALFFLQVKDFKAIVAKIDYTTIRDSLKLLMIAEVKLKSFNKNVSQIFTNIFIQQDEKKIIYSDYFNA